MLVKDAIGLKDDSDSPVPNFSVGQTAQVLAEFLGEGTENRFVTLQRDAANEEY